MGITRVFCNIYIETHNTIYSIDGVGAIQDLLREKSIIITRVFVLCMLKYKTQENSCERVGVTKGLWCEKLSDKNQGFLNNTF